MSPVIALCCGCESQLFCSAPRSGWWRPLLPAPGSGFPVAVNAACHLRVELGQRTGAEDGRATSGSCSAFPRKAANVVVKNPLP